MAESTQKIVVIPSDKGIAEEKTIRVLADALQETGSESVVFNANNIFNTNGLTASIAVYNSIKPAQDILDELVEWAEKHDPKLVERIETIKTDMSWNVDIKPQA